MSAMCLLTCAIASGRAGAGVTPPDLSCGDGSTQYVNFSGSDNTGTFTDYTIPTVNPPELISFIARGADGGDAALVDSEGADLCRGKGGIGAIVEGTFVIGPGVGELEPGGVLRFLPGGVGESSGTSGIASSDVSGGGGGGSGVLYQPPSSSSWIPLLVAGGGGGGYQGTGLGICSLSLKGGNGQLGTCGSDGGTRTSEAGGPGGCDGLGGTGTVRANGQGYAGGGGGYYGDGGGTDVGGKRFGGLRSESEGGLGGEAVLADGDFFGGWGCGGGGTGSQVDALGTNTIYVAAGGGGGGYSGGGAGGPGAAGGGGGSYCGFPRDQQPHLRALGWSRQRICRLSL